MIRAILGGVAVAVGTATLLLSVAWAFRRWTHWKQAGLLVLVPLVMVAAVASPAYAMGGTFNYDQRWSGHVASSLYGNCEWVQQTIGSGPSQGYPYIATVATVDGPSNCGNTSFEAAPGNLTMRQELESTSDGRQINICNFGVRIANDGFWAHAISTAFGWYQVPPPCGNTYYREKSINFYFDGANWNGGWHFGPWMYVRTWV